MKKVCLFCVLTGLIFISACVEPQQFTALENRVASLEMNNSRQVARQTRQNEQARMKFEKKLATIEKKLDNAPAITKEEYAELKYALRSCREDIQRLKGSVEELNHRIDTLEHHSSQDTEKKLTRLDQAISRNYEKLIRIEKYMGFEPSAGGEPEKTSSRSGEASAGSVNQDDATKLYNEAKKLLDEGDTTNARIKFENFINKYPDSDRADNARFWIADSYYYEKWFEKAILEYQKVIEKYPDSNKSAAARLKQGYAFAELGEKANARLILKELIKKYPDSPEAKYAREKLKNLK